MFVRSTSPSTWLTLKFKRIGSGMLWVWYVCQVQVSWIWHVCQTPVTLGLTDCQVQVS